MIADKEALVVSLAGEITWQNASRLRERLMLLVQKGYRSLVLNMESVTYADSSGLSVFISVSRALRSMSGNLILINVAESIARALRQTRLSDFIPVVSRDASRHGKVSVPVDEAPVRVRTICVPCDASYMSETRKTVSEMFASLALPRDTTYDLVLALGEALGNAFDHGGGATGEEGSVTVTISIYSDRIVMEVNDCGCGYSYSEGDELPVPTETRGRGIRLMLMLADSIEVAPRKAGSGTCVRLVKMIADPERRRDRKAHAEVHEVQETGSEAGVPMCPRASMQATPA